MTVEKMTVETRILVTGFGSFPGVPHNPCIDIINHIQSHSLYVAGNIQTLVLPVSYSQSTDVLDTAIAQWAPDGIIELGVSRRAEGLKLESTAHNLRNARIPDVDGIHCINQSITEDSPINSTKQSTLPLLDIVEGLTRMTENTVKVQHSTDPGRYVCNNIYWHTMQVYPQIPSVFVHIPMLTTENSTSVKNGVLKVLDAIIQCVESTSGPLKV